jgi:hypothetical protein
MSGAPTVLVIEPDHFMRERIASACNARGWPTKAASSATIGLGIAAWFQPTIVVVDAIEAGMVAGSFVKLLRHGRSEQVDVVGIGVDGHCGLEHSISIERPLEIDKVLEAVAELIDARG